MAERRHSTSMGARENSSPLTREDDSSPLIPEHQSLDNSGPYLCRKDGLVLHCPPVKEPPSLWENPYSATTSWKPCAERLDGEISDGNARVGYLLDVMGEALRWNLWQNIGKKNAHVDSSKRVGKQSTVKVKQEVVDNSWRGHHWQPPVVSF